VSQCPLPPLSMWSGTVVDWMEARTTRSTVVAEGGRGGVRYSHTATHSDRGITRRRDTTSRRVVVVVVAVVVARLAHHKGHLLVHRPREELGHQVLQGHRKQEAHRRQRPNNSSHHRCRRVHRCRRAHRCLGRPSRPGEAGHHRSRVDLRGHPPNRVDLPGHRSKEPLPRQHSQPAGKCLR
jgi:hypothetical protein